VIAQSGRVSARPSGTEVVYKIYEESFESDAHLDTIVSAARAMMSTALASVDPGQGGATR
jgi:phosphoglucomutase